MKNYLTRTIWLKRTHPEFSNIDNLSYRCKNLYNSTLFIYRQIAFENRNRYEDGDGPLKYPSFYDIREIMRQHDSYKEIGHTKIAGEIIKSASGDFFTSLKAIKSYYKDSKGFTGKPSIPNYKQSGENGRSPIIINYEAISKVRWRDGYVGFGILPNFRLKHCLDIDFKSVKQVSITPSNGEYKVIISYINNETFRELNPNINNNFFKSGIDLGINRLASIAITNGSGYLVNGRHLKYINDHYNSLIDDARSKLPNGIYTSRKLQALFKRRTNKINDYLHKASTKIIDLLYDKHVNKLIIGKK